MGIYEELQARGLIAQVTDEESVRELVNTGKATFCSISCYVAVQALAPTLRKELMDNPKQIYALDFL